MPLLYKLGQRGMLFFVNFCLLLAQLDMTESRQTRLN